MKKILTILLIICILYNDSNVAYAYAYLRDKTVTNTSKMSLRSASSFSGNGDGTKDKPYEITNAKQLNEVRNNLAAYYILTSNIDLSSFHNWNPIGDTDNPFVGHFNGNGFTIRNLKICDLESNYAGLFGECINSSIINVNLTGVSILIDTINVDYTENWKEWKPLYVGAIAARANNIENCSVNGMISVYNCLDVYVGGIVAWGKNVNKCINEASIDVLSNKDSRDSNDGEVSCGGIVGQTSAVFGEVTECTNKGSIEAISGNYMYCGGISGKDGTIKFCNNYGNLSGKTTNYVSYNSFAGNCNVGGIVGATSAETLYAVNYGNIYGYALKRGTCYAGGIAGYNGYYGDGEIKNCIVLSTSITAIKQLEKDDQYIDSFSMAGRIVGDIGTYRSDPIQDCYSLCTTLVNEEIPIENIASNAKNGESLEKSALEKIVKDFVKPTNDIIKMEQCKVTLKKNSFLYTGEQIKPLPIVSYKTSKLQHKKDFSLSYNNNKDIGTATILITGKGKYKGTIKIDFKIISKEQAAVEKKVYEIESQHNKAKSKMLKESKELFKKLETINSKVKQSIKNKVKKIPRPSNTSVNVLPKEVYKDFLNIYYNKIDSIEFNITSYKNVKTNADLVNKISEELVSSDGKFTFTSMGQTYTCEFGQVGEWGALWTNGKIRNEKTKVTYIWQTVDINEEDIKDEMSFLKEYANLKIAEAKEQCILDGGNVLQIEKFKIFLKKVISKKGMFALNGVSPETASYAKSLSEAINKLIQLNKAYSIIINFNLYSTDYDKIIGKIHNFSKIFKEWQEVVSEL